ncbi:MAG: Hsp70 family protein, partial [Candidatus Omnitrophota bacterium]|nr:Hsp70 family protein [Candidatus Omnitrophota bacterium]
KAKIELSNVLETDLNLPFITADASGPKHLTMKLTRATLERLIEPLINRCRAPVENAIRDSKLQPSQIDRIILVGGPTRMPIVQRFVEEMVGKKVERGVDPMECVAMGAAIQVGIIKGDVKDVLLLDVTPLSLGIETLGGVFTKLIERNTTVPTRKSQIFSTAADNQPAVTVRVLQGERQMAADNTELGRFDLVGIPPAPRGVPQIEVTFDIDANGIVHVSAKDLGTGKEQSIKITAPEKLSKEEIEKMVRQAEQFSQADTQRKELVEAKNHADQLIYSTEKTLKDLGDKVSQSDRLASEQATRDLQDAVKSEDAARIKRGVEALTQVSHKLAEEIYKKQQATSDKQPFDAAQGKHATREETAEKGKDDKVVDAEFKVQDDKAS